MKSLSKLLITSLALLSFAGCETNDDRYYFSYYTYKNESSSDITIEIAARSVTADDFNEYNYAYENHTISQGDELTLFYEGSSDYSEFPLYIFEKPGRRFNVTLTVANGNKKVIEYSKERTGLYDNKNYKLLSTNKRSKIKYYEYTFTDAFFENGTPLTE